MCVNSNVETVQERVKTARTAAEIRRWLEAADTCRHCPEPNQGDGRASDCFCRWNQQLRLKNLIAYTMEEHQWM